MATFRWPARRTEVTKPAFPTPYVISNLRTGGLWHTWFDRDLSIAGRVVVTDANGEFSSKLVKIDRPILRIPTLAIHLDRTQNDGFKFNPETEFVPILGQVADNLNTAKPKSAWQSTAPGPTTGIAHNHHPQLITLLAEELSVSEDSIQDFELFVPGSPASLRAIFDALNC